MAIFRGISFPFRKSATAFPVPSTDDSLIKESLVQIIMTGNGERVMRPEFGSNALSFIFEPNDDTLANMIRSTVSKAIARYEPRVVVRDIAVSREDSLVEVNISYTGKTTGQDQKVTLTVGSP